MMIWSLIVSSLPWFPSALSPFSLIILAIMLILSRFPWLGLFCIVVAIQEIRITDRVEMLWPESAQVVSCSGEVRVDRILTQAIDFSSASATWTRIDCQGFEEGSRVKLQAGPNYRFQTGDRVQGLFRLSPLIGFQNPGGFDARRHALANGWRVKAQLVDGEILPQTSQRSSQRDQTNAWPNPIRGLAQALLFGEKQALDPRVLAVFETLGLSHLLAISGLHVGLVLAALWWLAGRSVWPRHPHHRAIFRSGIVCIGAYFIASWTLFSPSVVRAGVMATLLSLIQLFGLRFTLHQVIAITLVWIVVFDPMIALSTGFLMSAGAVLLIAQILWATRTRGLIHLLVIQLGFSCVLAVLLSHWLGFDYPWLGILANLLIVPLLPLLLLVLATALVFDWVWLIAVANTVISWGVETLELLLFRTNFGVIPSEWVLACLFALGASVLLPKPSPRWSFLALVIPLMFLFESREVDRLVIHDVGQGSASTLISGTTRAIFDLAAGQAERWSRTGQFLPMSRGFDLAAILISHGDMDHSGGLVSALRQVSIPPVIEGGGSMGDWVRPCHATHRLGDVLVELLWPIGPVEGSENRRSCVYLLSAHGRSVLMMGDADWFAESQVLKALHRRNLLGEIDVVVVSHHGARDGSNPSFVQLVGAKHALISVGQSNRYGHPHREVLAGWAEAGAQLHRTDLDGALIFDFRDGQVSRYRQQKPSRWSQEPIGQRSNGRSDQSIAGSRADG
ncbi:MAG: ComEC/Rec2 family competence protein [Litoricolaceae bacterium]|nr:ComEC/Rec2 family competence protein [Litorivicinaceae bacterium]